MKICSIYIKGYQQFQDTYLDFTHPETGEPLQKICFIGRNGTGKTTLLYSIFQFVFNIGKNKISSNKSFFPGHGNHMFFCKLINEEGKQFWVIWISNYGRKLFYVNYEIEFDFRWKNLLRSEVNDLDLNGLENYVELFNEYSETSTEVISNRNYLSDIQLKSNSNDLLIYSPAESQNNLYLSIDDVPEMNVSNALDLKDNFFYAHLVSQETASFFWQILIYSIKNRESERIAFEELPENLEKVKKDLIEEFESKNPKILDKLGSLWNRILEKADLEFDVKNASNPIQLTDNLKAYIIHKKTGERINYNQLSTGIRNFIFRIGHIYSLYFNREIKNGFLLIDEPENSLFPDFLYDLIDIYQEITTDKNGENNTQMFFATHNPIVAAQFEPHERIVLEWNENGSITAHKGSAPAGDDPNDVLTQDFGVRNLMGKEGLKKWEEYLSLRKKLRKSNDETEKQQLVDEISKIGRKYNFES